MISAVVLLGLSDVKQSLARFAVSSSAFRLWCPNLNRVKRKGKNRVIDARGQGVLRVVLSTSKLSFWCSHGSSDACQHPNHPSEGSHLLFAAQSHR